MNLCPIQISLLFVHFLLTSKIGSSSSTLLTGDVSINCGSNGASTARNGRQWLGDVQPKPSSLLQINGKSTTSTVTNKLTLDDPVPHKTARISRSRFSYAFQVDPGQKIIRLHFTPSPYKGFRDFKDFFSVQSGGFTLLRNFSASLTADALRVNTFSKEFCLNIQKNQQLTIIFSPETSQSLDTYAFVNGIEILVVPAALSYFGRGDSGLRVVGEKSMVYVDDNTVVVGFRYMVRLHFSEVGLKIAGTGELRFEVLINDMIAQTNSDILTARDGNYFLLYRDYIVMMGGLKTDGKRDILISIQSHDELRDGHGVLSGFEIVKLSNHDYSLASPNPLPPPQNSPSKIRYLISILGHINGTSTVAITIISLINIIVYKLRETRKGSSAEEEKRPSDRAERLFTEFALTEMKTATESFNVRFLVGKGGFGNVYKGLLRGKDVAIKRLKPGSSQGAHEFFTEIETLSELRHINLVSLIGYCKEREEMILVYEYMLNGTLADHLYKNTRRNRNFSSRCLTWKQRLSICIEAGRGLDYLHTGHRIIHRDVKASNILLDENFTAKVSDFGLAKPDSLKTYVEVAEKCLHDEPKNRPTMSQVVLQLEVALEQQGNRILALPNQIAPVASDVSLSNEDIMTLSESAEESRSAISSVTQTVVFSPAKQANSNNSPAQSNKELRKPKKRKLSWCLACCACLRKAKQGREHFSLGPDIQAADTNLLKLDQTKTKVAVGVNQSLILFRHFSLREIRYATNGFNDSFLIGKGGFSSVYKGLIDDGTTTVAIKRVTHKTDRVASELKSEIRILSALRHRHLVPLIGYCNEKREMILVYEYMAQGTVRDYLYESANSPLTWKQRLEICLGAAKGLDYLHSGAEHPIIHRNVKSSNILLDENWVAKMDGFDLISKVIYDTDWSQVSTHVQGTYGYLDPEYFQSSRLTFKSDVYSFGIVLFEILCGRRPIISSLPTKQANLATWGISCFQKGKLDKIIDSNLKGQIAAECLKEFAGTAVACVSLTGNKRPAMRDVVRSLEFAMQLQEAAAIDEAPPLASHIDTVKSQYEQGLESTQNQKAKLLSLSSVKQSDDSSS